MNKLGPVLCGLNLNHLALILMYGQGQSQIGTPVVKGLMQKFQDDSLALNETCSNTKFYVYWYYGYCVT